MLELIFFWIVGIINLLRILYMRILGKRVLFCKNARRQRFATTIRCTRKELIWCFSIQHTRCLLSRRADWPPQPRIPPPPHSSVYEITTAHTHTRMHTGLWERHRADKRCTPSLLYTADKWAAWMFCLMPFLSTLPSPRFSTPNCAAIQRKRHKQTHTEARERVALCATYTDPP